MAPRSALPFTIVIDGEPRELVLELHGETCSAAQVGELVERVLDVVTDYVEGPRAVSDGDVVQALTLAAALRLVAAGVPVPTARALLSQVAALANETVEGAALATGARH